MRYRKPRRALAGRAHLAAAFKPQVSHGKKTYARGAMVEEADAVC
jgi:hypothetical protein